MHQQGKEIRIAPGNGRRTDQNMTLTRGMLNATINRFQRPDDGVVRIGDTDVLALGRRARREFRRDRLGIVLPQPSENLLDQLDAAANVRWAAQQRRIPQGMSAPTDLAQLLAAVGLAAARSRHVRELSGGEQQRLAVACALAGGPELVILDEPTASLDRANATILVEVLAAVASHGATMVIATHDPLVMEAGDVMVELDHGRHPQEVQLLEQEAREVAGQEGERNERHDPDQLAAE